MRRRSALVAALTVGAVLTAACGGDERSNPPPAEKKGQAQVGCAIVVPGNDAPSGPAGVAAERAVFMDRRCGEYLSAWCSQFDEGEATRRGCPTKTSPKGRYSEALETCEGFAAGPHEQGGDRLTKRLADCVRENIG